MWTPSGPFTLPLSSDTTRHDQDGGPFRDRREPPRPKRRLVMPKPRRLDNKCGFPEQTYFPSSPTRSSTLVSGLETKDR